jgi:hypothetical protein
MCEDAPCCGCCGQLDAHPDFHNIQTEIEDDNNAFLAREHDAMTQEDEPHYEPAEDAHLEEAFESTCEPEFFGGE